MQVAKLSISIPQPLLRFVEDYRHSHAFKSRSQVIEKALELLRERELEEAYALAAEESDPDWEVTVADGLTDEAW
ncbi:CopG family transcriptional regulator [Nodosilinea sp. LEGE 07298]|uniref:ribbon-helix-helix domain-containing protein n=1 Tax=Nodosilinea sp. LEGE 07298 TaxID=2777970 RepID=UPI001881CB39|nr:ribbon-helix-helix domain-containing protein [Nodosilinea sp. LEGE 07298]MBE9107967.1 CopG family transcriptional regulator [Nodosilinea sp. LEGE 07298]